MRQTTDVLQQMLAEARARRPPIADADAWGDWLAELAQIIQALPHFAQRWAAVVWMSNDLVRAHPGLSLDVAYWRLAQDVLSRTDLESMLPQPEDE